MQASVDGKKEYSLHSHLDDKFLDYGCQQQFECDLAKHMLALKPEERPSCDEIIKRIRKIKEEKRFRPLGMVIVRGYFLNQKSEIVTQILPKLSILNFLSLKT